MFQQLLELFENNTGKALLFMATGVGSFLEEVLAPIPSPLVMGGSGSALSTVNTNQVWLYILAFAIVGSIGKTIGSLVIYYIADKGEDVLIKKFGRYLGISHKEIESIGKYLNHGWRDDIVLFALRAIPIVPSAPISAVSGLIKLNLRTFIVSTFLGNCVRNVLFLYIGYQGLTLLDGQNQVSTLAKYVFVGLLLIGFVFVVYKRRQFKKATS